MGFAPDPKKAATVVPDLATAAGDTSDFKNWTYTLRDGVKYDDGTAITSKDIKYALERNFALDVISGGPNQYFLPLLDGGAAKTGTPTYQSAIIRPGAMANGAPRRRRTKTIVFHLTRPTRTSTT
jgi:peptide/nickel transport system substrate-binding protein